MENFAEWDEIEIKTKAFAHLSKERKEIEEDDYKEKNPTCRAQVCQVLYQFVNLFTRSEIKLHVQIVLFAYAVNVIIEFILKKFIKLLSYSHYALELLVSRVRSQLKLFRHKQQAASTKQFAFCQINLFTYAKKNSVDKLLYAPT